MLYRSCPTREVFNSSRLRCAYSAAFSKYSSLEAPGVKSSSNDTGSSLSFRKVWSPPAGTQRKSPDLP